MWSGWPGLLAVKKKKCLSCKYVKAMTTKTPCLKKALMNRGVLENLVFY